MDDITTIESAEDANDGVIVAIVRTSTLILLLLFSLFGNALLALSVGHASSKNPKPINSFVLSMAAFGLLECFATLSLSCGYSVERMWIFDNFLAGFNAAFVQLHNVGVLLTICAMTIDRYLAVTTSKKYHSTTSVHYANYAVLYTWIHAFLFALPALFQNQMMNVTARPFAERCLCGLVENTSAAFTLALGATCFVLPVTLIVLFMFLVSKTTDDERRSMDGLNSAEYAKYCINESDVLSEAARTKYVATLFVCYMIFKAPYVVVDAMTQLGVPSAYQPVHDPISNQTVVVDGSKMYYQTGVTFMMFAFSALFPIMTFMHFGNHWRRLHVLLCYKGSTLIQSTGHGRTINAAYRQQIAHKQRRLRQQSSVLGERSTKRSSDAVSTSASRRHQGRHHKKVPSSVSSTVSAGTISAVARATPSGRIQFRVPVLYPATDGLHLVAPPDGLVKSRLGGSTEQSSRAKWTSADASSREAASGARAGASSSSSESSPIDNDACSVVDKRVDVVDYDEDDYDPGYMGSDYNDDDDDDDDTESDLNQSANSATLIWNRRARRDTENSIPAPAPSRPGADGETHPPPPAAASEPTMGSRCGSRMLLIQHDDPSPSHPHPFAPTAHPVSAWNRMRKKRKATSRGSGVENFGYEKGPAVAGPVVESRPSTSPSAPSNSRDGDGDDVMIAQKPAAPYRPWTAGGDFATT